MSGGKQGSVLHLEKADGTCRFIVTKIFGGIVLVAIAAVTFNVSLSKQTHNQASQLVLANVEVLAVEGGADWT